MHSSTFAALRDGIARALILLATIAGLGACTSDDIGPVVLVTTAGSGNLIILDAANGEIIGEVDTFAMCEPMVACELDKLRASVYHPATGLLIAATSSNDEFCETCIVGIDLATGEAALIADNEELQNAAGMDLDVDGIGGLAVSRGIIFATIKSGEGGQVGLVSLGTDTPLAYLGLTGVAAELMMSFDLGNAIAFDDSSTLHYTTGAGLSTIDPTNADATHVGAITLEGFTSAADPGDEDFVRVNSLTILPTGEARGIFVDDGPRYLGALDLTTRVFSTVGFYGADDFDTATGYGRIDSLAWVPESAVADDIEEDAPPM